MQILKRVALAILLMGPTQFALRAQAAPDAGVPGGPLMPQSVILQPKQLIGVLPPWASASPSVHVESDTLDFPVPSLAAQDEIGCFALTTVFDDTGDGGPVVEWISKEGDRTLLSAGIGENGVALGLNARTILLSQSMTLDGGRVLVSFAGRFSRIISATLRPARELGVAALGGDSFARDPALIEGERRVLSVDEVSGADVKPRFGDHSEGNVIHAELAVLPIRIDQPGSEGVAEFIVPLSGLPQGSMLLAEVGGLDPESWIEVSINGESRGVLSGAPFSLQDPDVVFSRSGRLLVAGWRATSLFLPARLWKEGDNSVVMTLHRAPGDAGRAVYLRKVACDLLFDPLQGNKPALPGVPAPQNAFTTPDSQAPASDQLSTGSAYGNPSPALFHTSAPVTLPSTSH